MSKKSTSQTPIPPRDSIGSPSAAGAAFQRASERSQALSTIVELQLSNLQSLTETILPGEDVAILTAMTGRLEPVLEQARQLRQAADDGQAALDRGDEGGVETALGAVAQLEHELASVAKFDTEATALLAKFSQERFERAMAATARLEALSETVGVRSNVLDDKAFGQFAATAKAIMTRLKAVHDEEAKALGELLASIDGKRFATPEQNVEATALIRAVLEATQKRLACGRVRRAGDRPCGEPSLPLWTTSEKEPDGFFEWLHYTDSQQFRHRPKGVSGGFTRTEVVDAPPDKRKRLGRSGDQDSHD
jgi:hypothetical protein